MIDQKMIFFPCLTLILLTGFVLCTMFVRRIKCLKEGLVDKKYYKTYNTGDVEPRLVTQASRNFTNLHESPTFFYVLCLFALNFKIIDTAILTLAWVYVGLRIVHTLVHVNSNKINPRLLSYALSWLILVLMALTITFKII
jgi:hypothetical protein